MQTGRGGEYLYDNSNIKIYITGPLVSRPPPNLQAHWSFILHEVLGLSFTEYLEFTSQNYLKSH